MKLTRKQAIKNHRKMWRWIKEKTLERRRCVSKDEYFIEHNIHDSDIPFLGCYACDYIRGEPCEKCPIQWDGVSCSVLNKRGDGQGVFSKWVTAIMDSDFEKAAELAGIIAELPERS